MFGLCVPHGLFCLRARPSPPRRPCLSQATPLTLFSQYDYPSDIAENLTEVGHQAQAAWSTFANKNLKNTNLPIPIPAEKAKGTAQPKTLPHALSRAALAGATELGAEDRLGAALGTYAQAMDKVSCGSGAGRRLPWHGQAGLCARHRLDPLAV